MYKIIGWNFITILFLIYLIPYYGSAQGKITIDWDNMISVSKTTPTLQVVVLPPLERTSPIHDRCFEALEKLKADYVRFVPWYPYPHLSVPELRPPSEDSTFWDFSKIDPIVEDFMDAIQGNSVIMNFSTIPLWMFEKGDSLKVPTDPKKEFRPYSEGWQLKDTTLRQLTDYYVRLFNWYTKGGFTDELGKFHKSGYFYKFDYWEILNEMEHRLSPQLYTRIYDSIVIALKNISPDTKFIGLALGTTFNPNYYKRSTSNPSFFEYFLNPANHAPGVSIDGMSYHFYAYPDFNEQAIGDYQYSFFSQADGFLTVARYIESIKDRLSPETFTDVNEIGTILSNQKNIPHEYWNLSGALFAYIYIEMIKMGIEVVGESQLIGYPSYRYLSTGMLSLKDGSPNARYWVLKLLISNFNPGDNLVMSTSNNPDITVQGFITDQNRKILIINKRNKTIQLNLPPETKNALVNFVDGNTSFSIGKTTLMHQTIRLAPFSVMILTLKK